MVSVIEVSKCIIRKTPDPVSNLRLQKLLYYVQGWSLAIHDRPAFYERIEAWVHGPVVPAAFYLYRHFGWNPIKETGDATTLSLSQTEMDHIDEVLGVYGKFNATQLESLSHDESPWKDARNGLAPNEPSKEVITPEAMKAFFSARA